MSYKHTYKLISLNVELYKRSSLNSMAVAFRFLIVKHLLLTDFLQLFPYFLSLRLFTDIHYNRHITLCFI
jgi:hypothetical protein